MPNFRGGEIIKHGRSFLVATDGYRSQVHAQLGYGSQILLSDHVRVGHRGLARRFFIASFRPHAVTRSVSRQKIPDGHPSSVGSVKNQRISRLELLLHGIAARS